MWWKRLVLGTWMLTTLVLTRSYSGNLMSLLAVRYIPMPVQSLQDIIDQPVNLLMMRGSAQVQTILEADSGILRRIASLQQAGRFEFYDGREREGKLLNLVRRGGYVDIGEETGTLRVISQYFSKTGRCDFYLARDKLLPMMSSMAGAKNSPLVVALSERTTPNGLAPTRSSLVTAFPLCLKGQGNVVVERHTSHSLSNPKLCQLQPLYFSFTLCKLQEQPATSHTTCQRQEVRTGDHLTLEEYVRYRTLPRDSYSRSALITKVGKKWDHPTHSVVCVLLPMRNLAVWKSPRTLDVTIAQYWMRQGLSLP
ncbi:hypothetical protein Pcinc_009161 [Petrolisthes cinctipes]|uniref:Ionotropic glutamate receptor C-terminal domain-containing protein n=1 Tax=Petrolisthes cinctipes TaxID=88211 RepID=A0AAE1G5Y5_PETCI|nr:hypothetical protein Pcinc_009161 [Petrolisthes cinctipes]